MSFNVNFLLCEFMETTDNTTYTVEIRILFISFQVSWAHAGIKTGQGSTDGAPVVTTSATATIAETSVTNKPEGAAMTCVCGAGPAPRASTVST